MTDVLGGFFLVLEGTDGSGTTTQAELLATRIRASGREVHVTREPSTGPVGRFLREALTHNLKDTEGEATQLNWAVMAQLFAADRLDHLEREVFPALSRGAVVICDRYDLSSLIYQSATSPEGAEAVAWLKELNSRARRPHFTMVLDVSPDVAASRRAQRAGAEELYEKVDLQRRLCALYSRARDFLPEDRLAVLQADGPLQEVAQLIQASLATVAEFAWMGEERG